MREKLSYDHFGLSIYKLDDGTEWAVGDDTDKSRNNKGRTRVDRAARRAVIDSLWAFNTSFIVGFLARHHRAARHAFGSPDVERAIKKVQESLCEDAGPLIRVLIGPHLTAFVEEAISADGRGHFLSQYDGEEC